MGDGGRPPGRPTIITPELIEQFTREIKDVYYIQTAAALCGVSRSIVHRWMKDLNRAYREVPALHELDVDPAGYEWLEANDSRASVLAFMRRDREGRAVIVICNFTPVIHRNYRIGVPEPGHWAEFLNSDAEIYGGRFCD